VLGDLLNAPVRIYDLGRPVGMNHHHAIVVQQRPAFTLLKRVEKPNTCAGLRLPP
jgi:hypothetical protein